MIQETVSKKELRGMRVGQSRIFTLTDKKRINSVKVQVYDVEKDEDKDFVVRTDYDASSVCITRIK